ncbi:MAG: hypothetical protein FWB73_00415 [Treponema sp.]|nr:hypothetical protein [Treponema sp.]
MGNHVVLYQSPRPEIKIYKPDKDKPYIEFDTAKKSVLQSYTFGTSINEQKGKFTLTFYPDDDNLAIGKEAIFDQIEIMDIVEIYESKNHFNQKVDADIEFTEKVIPIFTGVIREKKYAAQKTEGGVNRKIYVSGHSIVGLINEFKINLDTQVTLLTSELANNDKVEKEFTQRFIQKNMEPLDIAFVVKKIWDSFVEISKEYGKSSTLKIEEYLKKWIGDADEIFDIDTTFKFHYPLGSIFSGQSTQTFYDIIANIVSEPVYEIFPFTDIKDGKMRLKIREVPFDANIWRDSEKMKYTKIDPKLVKSFDVKQNDNEVYTVFFSYIRGYALDEDKAFKIATQTAGDLPGVEKDSEKFQKYGYRPLLVTFNGYGKVEGKQDPDTNERRQNLNKRLKNWFGKMEEMYSGTITMETDMTKYMPQPGEIVGFLGGEFYVVDSEHSWNYNGSPETKITVSRGGIYDRSGNFSQFRNITKRYQEFKKIPNEVLTKIGAAAREAINAS